MPLPRAVTLPQLPIEYVVEPVPVASKACDCGAAAVALERKYAGEGVWSADFACNAHRTLAPIADAGPAELAAKDGP